MATTPVADDAPPVSAIPEPLTPPPGEEQTHSSYREDELLTGGNAVGMEGEMANLKVSSPKGYDGSDRGAST